MRRKLIALSIFILSATPALSTPVTIGSWNLRQLGWKNGKDIDAVARVARHMDVLALQEVMTVEALEDLELALEEKSGEDWDFLASEAIGRGSYKERYAFIWRKSALDWLDGAAVYTDDRDVFAREPMSMRFETSDGYRFVLASVHLIYGKNVAQRQAEATALHGYMDWLVANAGGSPVLLAGDFNLPPDDKAWSGVASVATPLFTSGATTLSPVNDRYVNLYDNIWVSGFEGLPVTGSGILDFPDLLRVDHEAARDYVSDHAPVWVTIDPDPEIGGF